GPRLAQQGLRVLPEFQRFFDLVLTILEELAGILDPAVQFIADRQPMRGIAAGRIEALDEPFDPIRNAKLRGDPDGIAAAPGRLIGTRAIPVLRKLLAKQFEAGSAAAQGRTENFPAPGGPAFLGAEPWIVATHRNGGQFQNRPAFDGGRA